MRYITNKNFIIASIVAIVASLVFLKLQNQGSNIQSYLGSHISHSDMDEYLSDKMRQNPIPGLALGIINDGKLTFQSYKGLENKLTNKPISKATLFESASMSKSVFAAFVMQHVEKGLIDLDTPLVNYYPIDYHHDVRYKQITARMALSHQTGWPNWRWDRKDNQLEFKHSPGETYLYSGEGYQYLAETLKHIHGGQWQDLERAFQKFVAQPLAMNNSTFIEPTPVSNLKAKPYDKNGELVDFASLAAYQRNKGVLVAAASLITNIEDFSKWMIGLMNDQLLSSKYKQQLLSAQIGTGHEFLSEIHYTLGFFEIKVPGLAQFYGHGGNNHGFTGYFALDPEKQWGFILLSNSEYGEELGLELLSYLAAGPTLWPYLVILSAILVLVICILWAVIKVIRKGLFN